MIVAHFEPFQTINASTGKPVVRERSMVVPILGGHFFEAGYCEIIAACLRVMGEYPIRIERKSPAVKATDNNSNDINRLAYPVKRIGDMLIRVSKPNFTGLPID